MPGGVGSPSGNPLSALEMTRLALFKMYNQQAAAASGGGPLGPGGPGGAPPVDVGRAMAEQQARAALAAAAARGENDNKENAAVGVNHQGHRRLGPQDNHLDVADDAVAAGDDGLRAGPGGWGQRRRGAGVSLCVVVELVVWWRWRWRRWV